MKKEQRAEADLLDMTPEEARAYLISKRTLAALSKKKIRELIAMGIDPRPMLLTIGNTGVLAERAQDSTGRASVVEQNSSSINSRTESTYAAILKTPPLSRLANVIGGSAALISTTDIALKRVAINEILGAGGDLAHKSIINAVVGKKIYAEELHLELNDVLADPTAVRGASAVVTIEDEDGNDMMVGVMNRYAGVLHVSMGGATAAVTKACHIAVAAGIGGNLGASRLIGYLLYREI